MTDGEDEFTSWAWLHGGALQRRAVLLTGDHELAEDLVQETLTKLYLGWSRVDREQNVVGYAHAILFRLFLSARRLRRAGEIPTGDLPERSLVPHDSAQRLDLATALLTLAPSARCVLVARYLDDRSVAETAAMMRRTQSWVKTTTARALLQLRECPDLLEEPVSTGSPSPTNPKDL